MAADAGWRNRRGRGCTASPPLPPRSRPTLRPHPWARTLHRQHLAQRGPALPNPTSLLHTAPTLCLAVCTAEELPTSRAWGARCAYIGAPLPRTPPSGSGAWRGRRVRCKNLLEAAAARRVPRWLHARVHSQTHPTQHHRILLTHTCAAGRPRTNLRQRARGRARADAP